MKRPESYNFCPICDRLVNVATRAKYCSAACATVAANRRRRKPVGK